ncbi:MAG: tyrosine--tRNA ligase [Armatimonadota bacterium]|nr:tyrosine--tRNA ligase [Armatimonadota bacterium]MDW8025304.1 tyrosine--tRNA ligase [Armatimonadota bacterium]
MLPAEVQFHILKRGSVEIVPEDEFLEKLKRSVATGKPLIVKLGLDPSVPDLHIGHSVVLRKLRQFQDLGHEVVIIIGDFTAMIGDPSGQVKTRPQLSREEVERNARTYAEQYCKILDRSKTKVTFNSEWLSKLSFEEVIKLASNVTVSQVLEREDFSRRLRSGSELRLHEILYPLCQAYDSVVLNADVEMGGIDQKFNILLGRELQRRLGKEPQVGFFMPLLIGLDGKEKMSKSLGNYVGIAEPPKEMFGKLMSMPDELMHDYFILCTDVPEDEIESILSGHPMEAKKRLAWEIVRIYHGEEEANEAKDEFERVFSRRELPTDVPEVVISLSKIGSEDGKLQLARLLCAIGVASSGREAHRLIEQGAVEINGERITDRFAKVEVKTGDIMRVGKHRWIKLIVES